MPKSKVHRVPPSMDMTPLVDLGFLLVTFFMLTATARPDEPVTVDMPSSVSEIKMPETDIMLITVSKDGMTVGGTSIMGLMMLAASPGSSVLVSATGNQAVEALEALDQLIQNKFGEEI